MIKKLAILLLALAISGGALVSLWVWQYAVTPGASSFAARQEHEPGSPGKPGRDGAVVIPPGAGVLGIERILANSGIITSDLRFRVLARLMGVSQRLQAGEYLFGSGATPVQILRKLAAGEVVRWPVTIPEGSTVADVAEILARQGLVEREQFLALAADQELIREIGLSVPRLEGYLFPDTYHLVRGQSAREIIRMMVDRLRQVLTELCGPATGGPSGWASGCSVEQGRDLSLHELLTLASIVEKETAKDEERPLIACVFLNRLQRNMRLQADPTVIYGLAAFDGNLTRRDLQSDSPYNTYKIKGLPPTPIASPGHASIAAVVRPARESFLYFVSRNDGSHYFSSTLREHSLAVARFQKIKRLGKN